jgi:MFS transporter, ACS family, tartrate transporter
MVLILMGVTGSGKTTVGKLLARELRWQFADADNFHPSANIEKMKGGTPLNDSDRAPWLAALRRALQGWNEAGKNMVLACSALKRSYRDELGAGRIQFVYLRGSYDLILQRLRSRHGHFASEAILKGQFADLEEPSDAITVDVNQTPEAIVSETIEKLKQLRPGYPDAAIMTNRIATGLESRIVRKLFVRLLPFLFFLYIVNYLDRINIGFAALQMRTQLGFSDRIFGVGFGIFFLGYFFLQVPSNLALARVGARRWISLIMMLWGVISCCMIFVRTPHGFYEMRFLLGAAEAGFFPGVILYLKNWFPANARARAVAWFMTANPLAGVIGGPISGALLGMHHFGIAGWQWMFVLEGLPAIVLAGVVLGTLNNSPEEAGWLNAEEKLWLAGVIAQERERHSAATRPGTRAAFLSLSWRIVLLTFVYFGLAASGYGIILWLPNYIHSLSGLGNLGIGVVSVIPYIATAVAMVLVGNRSDRTGQHRLHLAGASFAAALFLRVAAQTHSIVPGLAFVSLALMATFSMLGPLWATATSLMSSTAAAAGIAFINSFGNLGGFYGPYIIGAKRSSGGGFREGMLIITGLLVLSGVLASLVRGPGERPSPAAANPLQ